MNKLEKTELQNEIQTKLFASFKAYDLRATMDILTPEVYFWFGKGFIEKITTEEGLEKTIVIARDGRDNGDKFYNYLAAGIRASRSSAEPRPRASSPGCGVPRAFAPERSRTTATTRCSAASLRPPFPPPWLSRPERWGFGSSFGTSRIRPFRWRLTRRRM